MLEVTTMATTQAAGSQVLTQRLHSHLVGNCNLSRQIVKLENNIR